MDDRGLAGMTGDGDVEEKTEPRMCRMETKGAEDGWSGTGIIGES